MELEPHSFVLFNKAENRPRLRENQGVGADGEVASVTITVSTFSRRKRWILEYAATSAIDPRMMSIRTTPPLETRDDGGASSVGCVEFTFKYRRPISAGQTRFILIVMPRSHP
jgi:hypothetical protein